MTNSIAFQSPFYPVRAAQAQESSAAARGTPATTTCQPDIFRAASAETQNLALRKLPLLQRQKGDTTLKLQRGLAILKSLSSAYHKLNPAAAQSALDDANRDLATLQTQATLPSREQQAVIKAKVAQMAQHVQNLREELAALSSQADEILNHWVQHLSIHHVADLITLAEHGDLVLPEPSPEAAQRQIQRLGPVLFGRFLARAGRNIMVLVDGRGGFSQAHPIIGGAHANIQIHTLNYIYKNFAQELWANRTQRSLCPAQAQLALLQSLNRTGGHLNRFAEQPRKLLQLQTWHAQRKAELRERLATIGAVASPASTGASTTATRPTTPTQQTLSPFTQKVRIAPPSLGPYQPITASWPPPRPAPAPGRRVMPGNLGAPGQPAGLNAPFRQITQVVAPLENDLWRRAEQECAALLTGVNNSGR